MTARDSRENAAEWSRALRPDILSFKPYAHAVDVDELKRRHGLERVCKMGSNENPLGPSPQVLKALKASAGEAARYPVPDNGNVIRAVALHLGVDSARIVAGNGSDEIIDLIIRVAATPGRDRILSTDPCFDVYCLQSRLCGVDFEAVPLGRDMGLDVRAIADRADERTAVVFVANPNNPTGMAVPARELEELAGRLSPQTLLVVDEAYVEFTDPRSEYDLVPALATVANLAIMRTFSKAWGLAGLRLGYGVLPETLADYMRRCQIPFSVNRMAQAACQAALDDAAHLEASRALAITGRELLSRRLGGLGCEVWPSQSNFVMFRPPRPASEVHEALLRQGVIIRPLAPSGLEGLLRVSVGTPEENDIFLGALALALDPDLGRVG